MCIYIFAHHSTYITHEKKNVPNLNLPLNKIHVRLDSDTHTILKAKQNQMIAC